MQLSTKAKSHCYFGDKAGSLKAPINFAVEFVYPHRKDEKRATVRAVQSFDRDICSERSCYPATGNLLIGREGRLSATSTCGMTRPQRYCIVSHLEDKKKCFTCYSREPWARYRNERSHRIENVISDGYDLRVKKWWQSENGVQNVSIRLDLEAEFHFTHLVMTFKSFRPAAMLIERSSDFGKTWKVYRYFAYDCAESFPGVYEGIPRKHTDVVCDSHYSFVAPSSGGEVVFKVLSPHIPLADPYAEEIQDLLRLTNLRINFTKLHTLGDNILDRRPEITEKYYYAVYNIVVRGSCSCYGHASQCKPIEGDFVTFVESHRTNMVYGRCECTHHTKGMNCEQCEDFYNDLPWQPAIDRERNACKKCNCNHHATKCHFDRAVYEASGYVSGGVCDDCQHNTMGKNCEQCKPYFYKDPQREITDPYVCLPCRCDLRGSLNEGICDGETVAEQNLVAGRCRCKTHVAGDSCDQCENGYWNLQHENPDGCQPCTCHLLGTVRNEGCNKQTGECTCKRLVAGENCDRCLEEHWGLSDDADGCKPCDCDIGGALDNNCDVQNGQCRCRSHFVGRRCDQPESGYFCANLDFYTYEAEDAKIDGPAEVELREPYSDGRRHWTGTGMVRVREKSGLEFIVDNINVAMDFHVVLRFESHLAAAWQNVKINVIRPELPSATSPCHNTIPKDDLLQVVLQPGERYFESVEQICLEPHVQYRIQVNFDEYQRGFPDRSVSLLVDSLVLIPVVSKLPVFAGEDDWSHYKLREFEHYRCRHYVLRLTPLSDIPEPCRKYICPVAASIVDRGVECSCDPTGSLSGICNVLGGQCQCKQNVGGQQCDRCSPGTYGFGPQGCTACDCSSVGSLHNFCHVNTGQCECREGVYGRQCDQCQPGYWGFPNCRPCICNGHADICDQNTGVCIDCRDLTTGDQCDQCQNGYYGDPRLGANLPCRPCPCPGGPGSGFQHADTCYLDPSTQNVFCNCRHGYEGERCDRCAMNYWGNPTEVGGTCAPCDCSGNIDVTVSDSCDRKTGRCLKCLYNTEGFSCENCLPGFFGEAKTQSCKKCVCNVLGTNVTAGPCDRVTGQCPCLPNVTGLECDACIPNHWKIASGAGCFDCECDPHGVITTSSGEPLMQCNEFDGQCHCKEGRGGSSCGECENYYWGDPRVECKKCECNPIGSATLQCHRNNGTCICMPGSGGPHCDRCDRGHTGTWPYCEPCGECFRNWDEVLKKLKEDTQELIDDASKVEDTGVSSVYDSDFKALEKQLGELRAAIERANLSQSDIASLQENATKFESHLESVRSKLNALDNGISEIDANVAMSEEHLNSLIKETSALRAKVNELEQSATRLRESDAEGAYNVTKEAAEVSLQAQQKAEATEHLIAQSEKATRETKEYLDEHAEEFEVQFKQNQAVLDELEEKARLLSANMPELNKMVCGAKSDTCDDLCGGAGCGKCGGPSCQEGAVTKSEQALQFSNEATEKLKAKQQKAHEMMERLREAQGNSEVALLDARQAYETAVKVAQGANDSRSALTSLLERVDKFKQAKGASPDEIRALAQEVMNTTISLSPEQIQELARNISDSLSKLTNIDAILAETHNNLMQAQKLKDRADQAKIRIEAVEKAAQEVIGALNSSKQLREKADDDLIAARTDIDAAKDDLEQAIADTRLAEEVTNESSKALQTMKQDMEKVEVEYLRIGRDVERALTVADLAREKARQNEEKRKLLDVELNRTQDLLQSRIGSNNKLKTRAEELRQLANKLLESTDNHLNEIQEEQKQFDANELQLSMFGKTLVDLNLRLDGYTRAIDEKVKFYESCD